MKFLINVVLVRAGYCFCIAISIATGGVLFGAYGTHYPPIPIHSTCRGRCCQLTVLLSVDKSVERNVILEETKSCM